MKCFNLPFRSITLHLEINKSGNDFTVSSSKITGWLKRYARWVKELPEEKSPAGMNAVELFTTQLFCVPEKTKKILETIKNCNFVSKVHVNLRDAVLHKQELDEIRKAYSVGFLSIHVSESDLPYVSSIENVVKKLYAACNCEILFLGTAEIFDKINVFASETLNTKEVAFFPEHSVELLARPPKYPVQPCENRLQLHMSAKGDIYPCQGLVEIERCAIGNVADKDFSRYFAYKCGEDCLEKLCLRGPGLSKSGKVGDFNLPWICRRHLYEITKNG